MSSPILQTYNFPRLSQPEQSWEGSLRALMQLAYPGPGRFQGLQLGLPPGGSTVPTLSQGYLIAGDSVVGPIGATTMPPLPRNVARRNLYFAVPRGYFYFEDTTDPAKTPGVNDVWVATVSTSDDADPELLSTGQSQSLGNGTYIFHGLINLGAIATGSVKICDFPKPEQFRFMRIMFAFTRIITAASVVTATDDVFALEYESASISKAALVSVNNAALGAAAGSQVAATINPILAPTDTVLSIYHNLTDANASIVAGLVEYHIGVQCF